MPRRSRLPEGWAPSAEIRRRVLPALRGGRGFLALVACLAASLHATPAAASADDGIALSVASVDGSGLLDLTWSGGIPPYSVYRSSNPSGLVAPANLAAVTGTPQWSETPPAERILYYEVRGVGCTADVDCASGHCVDSVCCDAGCAGMCEACDLPGAVGICTPIPAGQDPADECVPGQACDGAGACAPCPAEICDGLDNDCDGLVDEGISDRVLPCSERQSYLDCRPYSNDACILGTGPCECNWDAVYLLLDGSDKCPLSNEAEPKYDECLSGPFCYDIPCQDRVTLSQCRPDDCASRGECMCGWDAVSVGPNPYPCCPSSDYYAICSTQPTGPTCDYCAGADESDPCHVQIQGTAPFCYALSGGCGGGAIVAPPPAPGG